MRSTESLVEVFAVIIIVLVFSVVWIPAVQFMFKGQPLLQFPATGSFEFFLLAFAAPGLGAIVILIAILQWLDTD